MGTGDAASTVYTGPIVYQREPRWELGNPLTASKVLYKLDPLLLLITTRQKVRGVKHFVERDKLARQMFYLSLRVSNCVLVCHSVDYSTPVERDY